MTFILPNNDGEAKSFSDGTIEYSYISTDGSIVTERNDELDAEEVVQCVQERYDRFHEAPTNARESDRSRRERKRISAQSSTTLRRAWVLMDEDLKMEYVMMMSHESHHGIRKPENIEAPEESGPIGDDGHAL